MSTEKEVLPMDILGIIGSVFGYAWTVLKVLFSVPLVGWVFEGGFWLLVVYALYRYTPVAVLNALKRALGVVWPWVAPYLSVATAGLRRVLVRVLADPDMLRQPGDAPPKVVYKEVRVTRSFKSNIFLRARWWGAGVLSLLGFQHWESVAPVIWRLLAALGV